MYLLGYDIGSSSIKATLLDAETGVPVAAATSPKTELDIKAIKPGWAEQDPHTWWHHLKQATAEIAATTKVDLADVQAIGISYQMHGLVLIDKSLKPLRPAIIWCDSRAVSIGDQAFADLGSKDCLNRLLNSPGNFTASKIKWVMQNEPHIFANAYKAMLPGDYIAMKLTDRVTTTVSGLSEAMLWDFQAQGISKMLLDYYGIPAELLAETVETFGLQGELTTAAAKELSLKPGIPIAYRAGDQPNNAFSLGVLEPGQIAATAGTSGVVYGITDQANHDPLSRVNTFVHVNNTAQQQRNGVLLCVSGTGILNSWLKQNTADASLDYHHLNDMAAKAPIGAEGLVILPYGNGAERTLENKNLGASIHHLNFNVHDRTHLLRAAQEGIVFALNYGCEIMRSLGVSIDTVRAGHANMFLSSLFGQAFATVTGASVELYNTDGSQGAARGAGLGAGIYKSPDQAFVGLKTTHTINPDPADAQRYRQAYAHWLDTLQKQL